MAEKLTRCLLDETLQYIYELIFTIYCTSPIYEVGDNIAENRFNCQLEATWDINEHRQSPNATSQTLALNLFNEHAVILLHSLRSDGDVIK